MRIIRFVENYFWLLLMAGIGLGLGYPVYNDFFMSLLKPLLMVMLLLVFLKTDLVHILTHVKNYRLMVVLVFLLMIVIPLSLFMGLTMIDREFAIGILLLTSMPAAVSSPTLTDIVKGNIALSSGLAIVTSLVAPFTVPFLFRIINYDQLAIDSLEMFTDLAVLVFIPLLLSVLIKKIIPATVERAKNKFTAVNIAIIFIMVYAAMGSQRTLIFTDSVNILRMIGFLYIIYIILHLTGYLIAFNQNRESKIAITIGTAYRNNGMAIVLAAIHFEPAILVLMVLSEFPWNTLLAPFRRVMKYL
jgi:bile acid:Na+ symporter, BASS family